MSTQTIAVARPYRRRNARSAGRTAQAWLGRHWTDTWAVGLLAAALGIACYAWYDAHGMTLAFNDARIRELIARRVLFSRTPGLGQLGTTWLPLPSLLMAPLIWNNALFRDGLAGSLPSMVAYVIAAIYMYRLGRLVTGSRAGGWVAAAVLALNPSLLYMQSTAMSEVPSLTAFIVGIYYAVRLAQTHDSLDLVKCAAAVAAGTLIRYEDWVLAFALVPTLALLAWRHRGYALAEAWTILFGLLAFAGCAAWVIYNWVIFHDPLLSFFYGSSSHTFFANAPHRVLPARGHPVGSFVTYGLTVAGTVGWLVLPVALLGLLFFAWRVRLRSPTLPVYLTLVPFAFYWLVLYKGANTESLPQLGQGSYYNIRFGLAMIPAVGVFAAYLAVARPRVLGRLLLAGALALALAWGVLNSVQTPYVLREALYGQSGAPTEVAGKQEAAWLASRYHGGPVLITYVNSQTTLFYLLTKHKFADRAFITDANGAQFTAALARPWESVRWIVVDSDATDGVSPIWAALHGRTDWQRYFVLRTTLATTQIYERRVFSNPSTAVTAGAYAALFATRERGSLVSRPSVVAGRHVRPESARRTSRRRKGRPGRSRADHVNQRVPTTVAFVQASASRQASSAAPVPTPVPAPPQPALRSSSAGGEAEHAAAQRSAPRPSVRGGGGSRTSFGRGSFESSG